MGRGLNVVHGGAPVQILGVVEPKISLSIQVSDSEVVAGKDGKKVVKAGTPLTGDLTARNTPFTKAKKQGDGEEIPYYSDAVGILLHDVDVTDGAMTGALLIFGVVNVNRVDTDVAALYDEWVKAALKGVIWFIKD